MEYELNLDISAKQEREDTVSYYNAKKENLGIEVYDEIKEYLYKVKAYPLNYQKRYGNVRIAFTKRFHFGIY